MGSQLNPLPLFSVGSRERPSESLFPQLHFGEPSSGFTPGLRSASLGLGSASANLTPGPSFAHNLGCICLNDQCEAIFQHLHFETFSNDTKNTPMRGVLAPAVEL